MHARVSVGLALYRGSETTDELLSGANTAMYVAKAHGKAHYELFEPAMRDVAVERLGLRNDLEWAVPRSELAIHHQPVVDVLSGELRVSRPWCAGTIRRCSARTGSSCSPRRAA